MTQDEARAKLKEMNRSKVARETKLDPMWVCRFYKGHIKYPRENFETLVQYLERQERRA